MTGRQTLGALLIVWAIVLVVTFGRDGHNFVAVAAWWLALALGVIGAICLFLVEADHE